MKGKCNCGKPAKAEYLIYGKKVVTTTKFCQNCMPKFTYNNIIRIA